VIVASCGEEGWQIFEQEKERIALLITDIVMPGISGSDLAMKIRQSNSSLPIVLISGYSDRLLEQSCGITCMAKPLDLQLLVEQVHQSFK
jgi:FixJ family two-component response regulator